MIHQVTNSKANYNYNAYIYEDTEFKLHFHKNFELIYSVDGSHVIQIQHKKYVIDEGELLLIPPNTIHSFKVSKIGKIYVGVFSYEYVASFAKTNSNKLYSKFKCTDYIEAYLKKVLFHQAIPERYILKSALYAVCSECRNNATVISEKSGADINIINTILDYISENYTTNITMRALATDLGYEYHYFSNLFHKYFLINFKEFINLYRYEKACELIEQNECDIAKIAMESGFQSIRNFNKVFGELSGTTPTKYIKKQLT